MFVFVLFQVDGFKFWRFFKFKLWNRENRVTTICGRNGKLIVFGCFAWIRIGKSLTLKPVGTRIPLCWSPEIELNSDHYLIFLCFNWTLSKNRSKCSQGFCSDSQAEYALSFWAPIWFLVRVCLLLHLNQYWVERIQPWDFPTISKTSWLEKVSQSCPSPDWAVRWRREGWRWTNTNSRREGSWWEWIPRSREIKSSWIYSTHFVRFVVLLLLILHWVNSTKYP